ncbi:MAG: hypothetical protein AB7O45_13770, partial [Alphaproteobacteria bacterium]
RWRAAFGVALAALVAVGRVAGLRLGTTLAADRDGAGATALAAGCGRVDGLAVGSAGAGRALGAAAAGLAAGRATVCVRAAAALSAAPEAIARVVRMMVAQRTKT